ncbi:phosphopantetheine-binding protein [Teredinibacter sp. KSP-S5-2]|uniref:phosphopantetheine-binding protein n=1 Tax=Teredinibacter sp. KSP-S5-2 TaxID=3034506 RepID=UPI0029343F39|nr:phosphopantetheine-binding protein [Teredinibacter sp. KSP-S5-2]WNO09234.1 phosphopantetheine-binding protein [Teredinibacter sp. KSP-S5-2]
MEQLKQELKELIIEECEKDISPEEILDDQPLLRNPELDLDSLDVLQICMAIKTNYGVRIEGSNTARKLLQDINTLAGYVAENRK